MRKHLGACVAEALISLGRLDGENEPVVEQREGVDLGVVDRQCHEDDIKGPGHELAHQV